MTLELAGMRVLVLGLGVSGRSAAIFCARQGADVTVADERGRQELGDLGEVEAVARLELGRALPATGGFDLVVPSPGVPAARYADHGGRVWGDIELAWRALAVPIVAVTGTNGKSTTTRLIEAMLRATGVRAEAAGNIGVPALGLVGRPLDVAVLEVSSFQLETTEGFRPKVAVLLNITPDHLDRHGDFPSYVAAKARILANLEPSDTAVLSADDAVVRDLAKTTRGRVRFFSQREALPRGACLDAGALVLRDEKAVVRVPLELPALPGAHNRENVLAALLAVHAFGADAARASAALVAFRGLPHRMEIVRKRGGVTWVNDSKGTNVGAALRSLESFAERIVWIGGGKDKGLDFRPLAPLLKERARAAILIGESAPKLAVALAGSVPLHDAGDLARAVALAAQLAKPGDVVLLSPACASFDQFSSYEERGERFREAVDALPQEQRA